MRPLLHRPATMPNRLLFALILGLGLTACGAETSEALLAKAQQNLAAGDHKAAVIQLKSAIQKDERNAEARFQLGRVYLEERQFEAAEKEFRRAQEAGYAAESLSPLLARALSGQGAFERLLDEIPHPAPGSRGEADVLVARAIAHAGLGQKEEAQRNLERALAVAPENADVHLAQARLALADRDADAALRAINAALSHEPRHRDGWLFKGDVLRATGQAREASEAYKAALQIDPRHPGARLALAEIAIGENRLGDARKEVDAVLKASPKSLEARYTQALIDFREKRVEAARDHLADVLKFAPDYLPAVLLGGAIEFALGNLQTAETHLNKVIRVTPHNINALRMLAATQLRLGRPDDAARTLAPINLEKVEDTGVLALAGEIALAKKQFSKAAAYFDRAADLSPDNAGIRMQLGMARLAQGDDRAMADLQAASEMVGADDRIDSVIILNQLRQKQFDAALGSIAAFEKKQPQSPLLWNYRGAAYIGKKDAAKARNSFNQALKLDPKFFPAAANLAQLDRVEGETANARKRFESILKADPKHLQAMLALAEHARSNRDEKTYLSWLEKAAAANPEALQPRIALSRYWLAKGDGAKAVAAAREAVNAQPNNPAALDVLGTAQFGSKDFDNALGTYRKLADQFPNQAEPRLKLAQVQIAMRQADEARKSLQEAIRLKPDLTEAQLLLGSLEIQSARYDEALKIAKHIQQQNPKAAAGWVLEGDTALARKQHPAALAAFERAHKLAPSPATLIGQHRALAGLGRFDEGAQRLADWLAAHPQDHRTRLYLAEQLIAHGQYKAAADHYLLLNQQVPGNVVVLNNLASALSEIKDKRALGFAEQALKLQPDNPAIMDTVGWILVQQGLPEQGIKHLQQALSRMPDAAEIQWHLAAALAEGGHPTRARSELKRLLAGGTAFRHEQEARELLRQLEDSTR